MAEATLVNQRTIIGNQKQIVANQKKILSNQKSAEADARQPGEDPAQPAVDHREPEEDPGVRQERARQVAVSSQREGRATSRWDRPSPMQEAPEPH